NNTATIRRHFARSAGTPQSPLLDSRPNRNARGATMSDEAQIASKPEVSYDDFVKLDLRIAKITQAEPHPNADRLLRLQLDDGSGTPRQTCAGIRGHYQPEELVGKSIVIVANLAPRKIRGEESRG